MSQKNKELLKSIGLAMSGQLSFANLTGLIKTIVPSVPNGKAAGTMLEQFLVGIEYGTGNNRRPHLWCNEMQPVLVSEEFATDSQIGPPVVSSGIGFSAGVVAIDAVFDTDLGITKTYQNGDACFVTVRAQTSDTLLGWPMPKIIRAYFFSTVPIPNRLTPSEVLDVTGITYSGTLASGVQQQTIRILAASINYPVSGAALNAEMARIEGVVGNVFVDGVANLKSPYELILVRFTNGTPNVFTKSGTLSIQYTSPTGPKSLTLTHTNAITVLAGGTKTFFIGEGGELYLADGLSYCKAIQSGAF
jgi:hypothetical protein